jgi:hypothetical protein
MNKQQSTPRHGGAPAADSADVTTQTGTAFGAEGDQAMALQSQVGNAGMQEMLKQSQPGQEPAETMSPGQANYEAALGRLLGGELYKALAPHLTLDKVGEYADSGLTGALEGLVGLLEGAGEVDGDALDKFTEALTARYAQTASTWLEANPGVVEAISGWVDDHPRTVASIAVSAALLAAAAAILTDQDIPELKQKFKIGDSLTAELAAKLGTFQSLAIQRLHARLEYSAGSFSAALEGTREDGEIGGSATLGWSDETRSAELTGEFDGQGLSLYQFAGSLGLGDGRTLSGLGQGDKDGFSLFSATLETVDGDRTRTDAISYDPRADRFTVTEGYQFLLENGDKVGAEAALSSDGTGSVGGTYEGNPTDIEGLNFNLAAYLEQRNADSAYGLNLRSELGLTYTRGDFKSAFEAAMDTGGSSSFSGNASQDLGGGHSVGGDFRLDLGDRNLVNVGAFYGFQSEEQFRGFLAQYRYQSENDAHTLNMRVEEQLGVIYGRLETEVVLSNLGERYQTSATGAYFVDDDLALLGGVKYQVNEAGDDTWMPMVGAQVGGVPLTVTYDPSQKGVMIGLTIPFGRR